MNYIEQINAFWQKHEVHMFGATEIALYFHLLDICNKCSWTNPFKRRNTLICAQLGIAKSTLERVRNQLKQNGLIDFKSNGKGDTNITYRIISAEKKPLGKSKNEASADVLADTWGAALHDAPKVNPKPKPQTKTKEDEKSTFAPPVPDEVLAYFISQAPKTGWDAAKCDLHTQKFMNHYGSINWFVGRKRMADWRKAAAGWILRQAEFDKQSPGAAAKAFGNGETIRYTPPARSIKHPPTP